MKTIATLAGIFAAANSASYDVYDDSMDGFKTWAMRYNKTFADDDEVFARFKIWQDNLKVVTQHNQEADAQEQTFWLDMNAFAALTNQEYQQMYLNYHHKPNSTAPVNIFDPTGVKVPASVDWRTHQPAVVSPIKDQGQCGSCWAFSAVEAMEAVAALKMGTKVVEGSPQQLVDCVKNGQYNCNTGGEMHDGYKEVIKEGGLDTEASYRYTAKSKGKCHFKAGSVIPGTTNFKGYTKIKVDETALASAVATVPTVSIAIDASANAFQLYSHGIYNHKKCKKASDDLDHGVAIVGYGDLNGKAYWLVRNSWNTDWGMKGYILMSKDDNNQCGVATDATFPTY